MVERSTLRIGDWFADVDGHPQLLVRADLTLRYTRLGMYRGVRRLEDAATRVKYLGTNIPETFAMGSR